MLSVPHLPVVHYCQRRRLPTDDADSHFVLQAAGNSAGRGLVRCGAWTHLTAVVVAPCVHLADRELKVRSHTKHVWSYVSSHLLWAETNKPKTRHNLNSYLLLGASYSLYRHGKSSYGIHQKSQKIWLSLRLKNSNFNLRPLGGLSSGWISCINSFELFSTRHSLLLSQSEPLSGETHMPPLWPSYWAGWQIPALEQRLGWLSHFPVGCNHYGPRQRALHLKPKKISGPAAPFNPNVRWRIRCFAQLPSVASRMCGPLP